MYVFVCVVIRFFLYFSVHAIQVHLEYIYVSILKMLTSIYEALI